MGHDCFETFGVDPVDLDDPIEPRLEGYLPLEHFRTHDHDHSSRVRDMPWGKKRQKLAIFPDSLTYPDTAVDAVSVKLPLVLTNVGLEPLLINKTEIIGDFALVFLDKNELAPGEQIGIELTFNPKRSGATSGALYIDTGDAGGKELVKLSGSGI